MELDAFRSRLGVGQGRVRGAGGGHVFVLGEDEPGRRFRLMAGDYAEVVQTTDLTGVDFIRAQLRIRTPADVSPALSWAVHIMIGAETVATAIGRPGQRRVVTDLAANVSKRDGLHPVAVRLELVAD